MAPVRIFIGFEPRQAVAYNVCRFSIERRATKRIVIEPLILAHMPIKRRGLTEFTYSRYCVPELCGYEGQAIFLDADVVVLGDICELSALADTDACVSVVKHPKQRFEWPSVMVFNNSQCRKLTAEFIETGHPQSFEWAEVIGALPSEWNHLVGYDAPREDAKLVHFTQGIPVWPETAQCEYAAQWHVEHQTMNSTVSFQDLMGNSVHAERVLKRASG